MNTTKRSIVVSAILVIALCISLVAGATFALFTSESKVNIAVTSGKVDVTATVEDLALDTTLASPSGATATLNDDGLALVNFMPGDFVTFNIKIHNASTVSVKCRTIISYADDNGLFGGLVVSIGGTTYTGTTKISGYDVLAVGSADKTIAVTIALPEGSGNQYQGKSCTISYKVEAVQGNASTEDPRSDTYYIYTARDFVALQSATGVSRVEFLSDIDMAGCSWAGLKGGTAGTAFADSGVTFVGNGHSISNLPCAIVAGTTYPVTFQNLTIKNNTAMAATAYDSWTLNAAFVAYANACDLTFTNCKVENVKLETAGTKYGGAFVAYFGGDATDNCEITIDGCSVVNSKVIANGSTGGFAGHISAESTSIKDSSVTGSTISATDDSWRVGSVIGTIQTAAEFTNITSTGNTIEMWNVDDPTHQLAGRPSHEIFGRIVDPGSLIVGGTHYVTAATLKAVLEGTGAQNEIITLANDYVVVDAWTPIQYSAGHVIDGAGHSISGLTATLADGWYSLTIKNLTIKDSAISDITHGLDGYYTAGAFVSNMGNAGTLTLNNCHVKNSTVGAGNAKYAGAFVGYSTAAGVTITNCTVDADTTVKAAEGSIGGIIGFCQRTAGGEYKVADCTAKATLVGGEHVGKVVGTINGDELFVISNISHNASDATPLYKRLFTSNIEVDGTVYAPNC